jgi:hypothetical protein
MVLFLKSIHHNFGLPLLKASMCMTGKPIVSGLTRSILMVITLEGYTSFYLDHEQNIWLLCDKYLYTFNIPTASFKKIALLEKESHRAIAVPDQNGHVTRVWSYWLNREGAMETTWMLNTR